MLSAPEGTLVGIGLGWLGMVYFGGRIRNAVGNDAIAKLDRGISGTLGLACMIVGGLSGPTIEYLIRLAIQTIPIRSYLLFIVGIAFWVLLTQKDD